MVISDIKVRVCILCADHSIATHYEADVRQAVDAYPFGWELPGRTFLGNDEYRYSTNGLEKSPEIASGHNSSYFRELDSRTGRWWAVDPVTHPHQSPYSTFDNNPVVLSDPTGAATGTSGSVKQSQSYSSGSKTPSEMTSMIKNRDYIGEITESFIECRRCTIIIGDMSPKSRDLLDFTIQNLAERSYVFRYAYMSIHYSDRYYKLEEHANKKNGGTLGSYIKTVPFSPENQEKPGIIRFQKYANGKERTIHQAVVNEEIIHAAQCQYYHCEGLVEQRESVFLIEAEVRVFHALDGIYLETEWGIDKFAEEASNWISAVKQKKPITQNLQDEFDNAWANLVAYLADDDWGYVPAVGEGINHRGKLYGMNSAEVTLYRKVNDPDYVKKTLKPLYLKHVLDEYYKNPRVHNFEGKSESK